MIIKDGYFYLYYTDWNGKEPDAIHLAQAPVESNGLPGSWKKFYNGRFESAGLGGPSNPVISPLDQNDYSALPGVSWNTYLHRFIALSESKDGFYLSISKDAINWSKSTKLLEAQTANNNTQTGQVWNSYPTLLSPAKSSDRETDENMLLIYSEGLWQQTPHSMRIRSIKFSK